MRHVEDYLSGYTLVETPDRVGDGKPFYRSRFRFLAERECRRHNAARVIHSYRCKVIREEGRWCVVAFQNALQP